MGKSKIPFKTNLNQIVVLDKAGRARRADLAARFRSSKPKPIRAAKVDVDKEKRNLIRWVLKWVLLLPLSAYVLMWLLVLLVDFFKA